MDFYVMATFHGTDGDHGFVHGDEFELSLHLTQGAITIYDPPSGDDWEFADLYTFLQSWSTVSLVS